MPTVVAVETRPPRSARRAALAVGGAVAAAALVWLVLTITASPATISRVTVVNDSAVAVEIAVAPAPGASIVDLGPVGPRASRTVADVIDQGDTWVFVVDSARGHLGTIPVGREQLLGDRWTVHVPATLPGTRDGDVP